MKKIIILLLSAALCISAIFILFSLQRKTSTDDPLPKQTVHHVSLYHYFTGSLSGGIADIITLINGDSPNRKLLNHPLDHEAFKSMILTTLSTGNPPELFSYWAGAKTQDLVNRGFLEPLDDVWQQHDFDSLLSPPLVSTASVYNGKKYLLPIDQHIVVFFYSTSIFSSLNLDTPTTFDELVEIAETLLESNITPFALGAVERWPAQFWFDYLLLRSAGQDFRNRLMSGDAGYLDPRVVKVYSQWADLLNKGYFNPDANDLDWAEATRLLCDGSAAMTLMGTWAIQELTSQNCHFREEVDFDFFAFPIMNKELPRASVGPVDGLVVTRQSTGKEHAKAFLPYFLDENTQQAFSRGSGAFATSQNVTESSYSPLKQRLLQEIEVSEAWAFNYDLATHPDIAELGMDSFTELIAFPDQYEEILYSLDANIKKLIIHSSSTSQE